MPYWYPDEDAENDPAWWRALERVAQRTSADPSLPLVIPCEFMMMGRDDRSRRPSIWIYKHKITRCHLNLGENGRAYRYVPPPGVWSDGPHKYVAHRTLRIAVRHLELDRFPIPREEKYLCEACWALVQGRRGRTSYPVSDFG